MAADNVERVRGWLAAMTAGPEESLAAVAEFWDPDVDHYPVPKFPEARPCHGRQEFIQFLTRIWDSYSVFEWAIHELFAVGDDRVLAWVSVRAEGRTSGVRVEGDLYQCMWLRHGLFFRAEDHLTLRGALHALGLQGETLEAAGLRRN